ncbi:MULTISPECIES: SDR family oxidoreductase [Thalassospira]|uniref:Saccharopine dehydrogenase NADP binding domain-containing protein n=2 Tax=Thalassospira TaxID=168934 RepID=A0A367WBE9_9PROT|nr:MULTISPECIES: saccharopine dehydrogenase NADP-binding domain-containing protein [Thalassospira]MDG4718076.1 saccharopine dehydrogenase NADP-binding domain-containing protein [Thalassospira sp. FZY0004]RCK37852.1 hypothetical protein TH19_07410 [Thalassospira profundimaris]
MQTNKIITVLGAGGHTGRFVIDLLERKGLTARAATRTGRFTDLLGRDRFCETLDFSDAAGLDGLMRGAHAVINCAGPFLDSAKPAIKAALRARVPYLACDGKRSGYLCGYRALGGECLSGHPGPNRAGRGFCPRYDP